MAAPKKNSSVVTARARATIALPPMTLGFNSLTEPDTFDPEKPTFKLNGHLTPAGITQMVETIEEKVYTEAALAKLAEEAAIGGMKLKEPMSPADWLEGKLKEPKENSRQPLPHIVISNKAYTGPADKRKLREIACWDANNRKLNLKKLRLGAGSVIQAIVYPNLWASKVAGGVPQPSLKLVGVRVLKLVQWGGNRAPDQADDEDIKAVMGEDFEYDDLDAFAQGADDEPEDDDDDSGEQDDAPAPEEQAKGMF